MNLDKLLFSDEFMALGAAFDKSPKSATMEEYYKAFESLRDDQWKRLCIWAKDNMETFPKISHLKNQAGAWGFWGKRGGALFVSLDCACGYSFSLPRVMIEREQYYPCPGKSFGCNKEYQGGWLLNPTPSIKGVSCITAVNVDRYRHPISQPAKNGKLHTIQEVLGELVPQSTA